MNEIKFETGVDLAIDHRLSVLDTIESAILPDHLRREIKQKTLAAMDTLNIFFSDCSTQEIREIELEAGSRTSELIDFRAAIDRENFSRVIS